jgi:anti-sigma B factor antagonist
MLLQIHERQIEPGITHLEVIGRLTLGREAQRLETLTADLAQKGVTKVILDLTGVDYMDSSGIGIIMLGAGRFKQAGGRMVVVVPEGRVLQLFKTAGVDALLTISDSVNSAKAAVA